MKAILSGCSATNLNIMTEKQQRIGLFGGTFDPIHIGHLFLAEAARDKFSLERVLFLPNPAPYHRAKSRITPLEDRVNMTKLAIEDNEYFEFSDFEIRLPGDSYTSKTLEYFHEKYPDAKLFFIMGGDSLFSIEYWKEPEKIFSLAAILSGKREGQQHGASGILHPDNSAEDTDILLWEDKDENALDIRIDKKIKDLKDRFGAEIYNLYFPNIEISSSDIKARVRDGRSIKYCTPDKVAQYIYKKGLYTQ